MCVCSWSDSIRCFDCQSRFTQNRSITEILTSPKLNKRSQKTEQPRLPPDPKIVNMCHAIVSRFLCGHLLLNTASTCTNLIDCKQDLSIVPQPIVCSRCQNETKCVAVMYTMRCGCPYDHVLREWSCSAEQEAAQARGEEHVHIDPHAVVFPLSATWCGDEQCPHPHNLSEPKLLPLEIE